MPSGKLPQPLARPWARALKEQGGERFKLVVNVYEGAVIYLGAVCVALYASGRDRLETIERNLIGLEKPSLGHWTRLSRGILTFLDGDATPRGRLIADLKRCLDEPLKPGLCELHHSLREFFEFQSGPEAAEPRSRALTLADLLEEIVRLRNRVIAHGATPDRATVERLTPMEAALPHLEEALAPLFDRTLCHVTSYSQDAREGKRLHVMDLFATERAASLPSDDDGDSLVDRVFLREPGKTFRPIVSLHPLVIRRLCDGEEHVFFFGGKEYFNFACMHRPRVEEAQSRAMTELVSPPVAPTRSAPSAATAAVIPAARLEIGVERTGDPEPLELSAPSPQEAMFVGGRQRESRGGGRLIVGAILALVVVTASFATITHRRASGQATPAERSVVALPRPGAAEPPTDPREAVPPRPVEAATPTVAAVAEAPPPAPAAAPRDLRLPDAVRSGAPRFDVLTPKTDAMLFGVACDGRHGVVVVGEHGTILRSTDGGDHFSAVHDAKGAPLAKGALRAIWGDDRALYAVGDRETILVSTDGGADWTPSLRKGRRGKTTLLAAWGPGDGSVFVVGEGALVLHAAGPDAAFVSEPHRGAGDALRAVYGQQEDVWAVGLPGTVFRRDSKGYWIEREREEAKGERNLYGLYIDPAGSRIFVGDNRQYPKGLLFDQPPGRVPPPPLEMRNNPFYAVWGDAEGTLFVAGLAEKLLRKSGSSWTQLDGWPSMKRKLNGIAGCSDGLFVVGDGGLILRAR